jgi:hypothetical protein
MRGPSGKERRGGQGNRRREAKCRSSVDGGGVAPPVTVVVAAVIGVHTDGTLANRRQDMARARRKAGCGGGECVASRAEEEGGLR